MQINKLSQNPQKTEYMVIGHPCKPDALHMSGRLEINGSELNRVFKTKSFRVTVDANLKWDEHDKIVKGNFCGALASLRTLRNISPQSKLCSVYQTVVRPISCLSMLLWKVFTGVLYEEIYDHLEENHLLPVEQKGCRKRTRGTKDELFIDK